MNKKAILEIGNIINITSNWKMKKLEPYKILESYEYKIFKKQYPEICKIIELQTESDRVLRCQEKLNREKIMKEALKRYCYEVVGGLPLKWKDEAIEKMAIEIQDKSTEKIKDLINFVIDKTER